MATRERPLSPHLQVYRPMYTMVLSIAHRITGLALTASFLLFAYWLVALASGRGAYERATALIGSPLGLLVLAAFTLAFWYHFCAGIRHLVWDTGHMLEKPAARRSAVVVVAATVVLAIVSLAAMFQLYARAGGAA